MIMIMCGKNNFKSTTLLYVINNWKLKLIVSINSSDQ